MQRLLTLIISLTLLTTPALALDLIDSKKQVIGTIADMVDGDRPGYVWVARQQGDATYLLYCNRQECLSDDFVEYENDDCTGESGIRLSTVIGGRGGVCLGGGDGFSGNA